MSEAPELDQDFIERTVIAIDNLIDVLELNKCALQSKNKSIFSKMMAINHFRFLYYQHHVYESVTKQLLLTGVYAAQDNRDDCEAADSWRDDAYGHSIFAEHTSEETDKIKESAINKALRDTLLQNLVSMKLNPLD